MPLNLVQPDMSALAAYAGNTIGNLGLPVPDVRGYAEAGRGIAAGISTLGESLGKALQRTQARSEQTAAQARSDKQQSFNNSLKQQESDADVRYKNALIEKIKEATNYKQKDVPKEVLNQRAGLSSIYLVGYRNAKTPEEKEAIKQETLALAKEKNLYSDEEIGEMSKKSPDALSKIAYLDLATTKGVLDFDVNGKKRPKKPSSGSTSDEEDEEIGGSIDQNTYGKEVAKKHAEMEQTTYEDKTKADEAMIQLKTLEESSNMFGQGAPVLGTAKKVAADVATGLGFGDTAGAKDVSIGAGELQQQALSLARKSRVAGEGAMSDADLKLLMQQQPNVNDPLEVRNNKINILKVPFKLKQEKAEAMDMWKEQHGSSEGFETSWSKYVKSTTFLNRDKKGNITVDEDAIQGWKGAIFGQENQKSANPGFKAKDGRFWSKQQIDTAVATYNKTHPDSQIDFNGALKILGVE